MASPRVGITTSMISTLRAFTFIAVAILVIRRVFHFVDPDMGWHLRFGEWVATHGQVPETDLFSYTMQDFVWVNHEWMFDLLLYGIREHPNILATLFAFCILAPFAVWIRRSSSPLSLLYISAFAVMSFEVVGVRAQSLSFLIFSLFGFIIFHGLLRSVAVRFALPFLFLYWANVHGGFVAGIGIWAVALLVDVYERSKLKGKYEALKGALPDGASFVMSLVATCITPYGFGMWNEVLSTFSSPIIPYVSEWQSGFLYWPIILPLFLACTAVFIFLEVRENGAHRIRNILLFLPLAYEAIMHARMIAVFGAILLPIIIPRLDRFYDELCLAIGNKKLVASVFLFLLSLGLFAEVMLSSQFRVPLAPPENAYRTLAQMTDGARTTRTFIDFDLAGGMIGVYPEHKVFAAGYMPHWRDESGWSATEAFLDITFRKPGSWKEYFDVYNIDTVLLSTSRPENLKQIRAQMNGSVPEWAKTVATIFKLNEGPAFSLIDDLKDAQWCEVYRDNAAIILRAPTTEECEGK